MNQINQIYVTRFRGIVNTHLKDIGPLTLVTGAAGCNKSNMLDAIRVGCTGGNIERILCEGPFASVEATSVRNGTATPYSWNPLFHQPAGRQNEEPTGHGRNEHAAAITLEIGSEVTRTKLTETAAGTSPQDLRVNASDTAETIEQWVLWEPNERTEYRYQRTLPGIKHYYLSAYTTAEEIEKLLRTASEATRAKLGSEIERIGIRTNRIRTVEHDEPLTGAADIDDTTRPLRTLGRTAMLLTAIHCAAERTHEGVLLIDDVEPGSRAAADAIWRAMRWAYVEHDCQVFAATSSPRLLRAALQNEEDTVVAYARLKQCNDARPEATRYDERALATQVDYNLLD